MNNIKFSPGSVNDIPCKGECSDRYPGCHAECERYISWKEKMNDKRMAILKGRKETSEAKAFFKSMAGVPRKKRGK